MTIETLREQMITALKENNKFKKQVLSSIISTSMNIAIDKGCKDNITEETVNTAILKELKTANEMLDTCPSDRIEQLKEFTQRIEIIKSYAPRMMSEEEIRNFIKEIAQDNNIELALKNKGQIMKLIMTKLKGKADGKLVNNVIQEMLSNDK